MPLEENVCDWVTRGVLGVEIFVGLPLASSFATMAITLPPELARVVGVEFWLLTNGKLRWWLLVW